VGFFTRSASCNALPDKRQLGSYLIILIKPIPDLRAGLRTIADDLKKLKRPQGRMFSHWPELKRPTIQLA
jgi:hypothetical protein